MLHYLDRLCAALLARRSLEVQALLKHPLARALPRVVLEECMAMATAPLGSVRAPVQTLHFYHLTMQLLATGSPPAATRTAAAPAQLELELRAAS